MTTWGDLRADVREELKDPTGSKWSDSLLYIYIRDALNDYSLYLPLHQFRFLLAEEDGGYPLPSDYRKEVLIECPEGTFLTRLELIPGRRLRQRTAPTAYYIVGGVLYLNAETSSEVLLTYDAWHPTPAAADDDAFEFTVPTGDEELLRLYLKALAHGFVRSKSARLDRFKPVGQRDDNPLRPEVNDFYQDYMTKIYERLGGKAHFLHRKRA